MEYSTFWEDDSFSSSEVTPHKLCKPMFSIIYGELLSLPHPAILFA
jgi:hypothetical protein